MTQLPPPTGAPMTPTLPRVAAPTLPAPPETSLPTPADEFVGVVRPVSERPLALHIELPSGLKVRRDLGPVRPTRLLGATMIVTYTAVSAACAAFAWHFTQGWQRTNTWFEQQFVDSRDEAWATAFDRRTLQFGVVVAALTLVAALATAAWSRRIVSNTRSIGTTSVSPGWVTVCWFLPLVWFWAGFSQLRRAPRASWPVWSWQIAFVLPFVASWVATKAGQFQDLRDQATGGQRLETIQGHIRDQWITTLFFAGFTALATLLAARAVVVLARTFREIETVAPHE